MTGAIRRRQVGFVSSLGLIALLLALPSVAGAETPPLFWKKCLPGTSPGQCTQARGVATSPIDGHVYVADGGNERIQEYTAWGVFVRTWGSEGTGPGQFAKGGSFGALGVTVDSNGDVYVVDSDNSRVQKFSPSGEFLLMFGGEVNKTTGADICTSPDSPPSPRQV